MMKRTFPFAILALLSVASMFSCKKTETGRSFVLTYELKFDGTLINAPIGGTPQAMYTYTGYQPTTENLAAGVSTWQRSIQVTNATPGSTFTLSTPNALYFATSSATPTLKAEISVDGTTQAESTVNATLYTPNIGTGTVTVSYTTP
jgi:tetrahydromethanopterin S-methyltransferase subunit D